MLISIWILSSVLPSLVLSMNQQQKPINIDDYHLNSSINKVIIQSRVHLRLKRFHYQSESHKHLTYQRSLKMISKEHSAIPCKYLNVACKPDN